MNWHSEEKWVDWIDRLSADDFLIMKDFLPATLLEDIRNFLQQKLQEGDFSPAGLGSLFNKQIVTSIRGDHTFWLDKARDEKMADFFSIVEEMAAMLNRYCFLSLSGYEFHFAYYPPGTFYKRHLDQFKDRNNRMISVIFYLNEQWKSGDGGELKVFSGQHGEVLVEPRGGTCAVFRSDTVEHEVMKTNTDRFSLTGWLLYQPSNLGYLLTGQR